MVYGPQFWGSFGPPEECLLQVLFHRDLLHLGDVGVPAVHHHLPAKRAARQICERQWIKVLQAAGGLCWSWMYIEAQGRKLVLEGL